MPGAADFAFLSDGTYFALISDDYRRVIPRSRYFRTRLGLALSDHLRASTTRYPCTWPHWVPADTNLRELSITTWNRRYPYLPSRQPPT